MRKDQREEGTAMWDTALWLEDVITLAVVLALPAWLLAEEIVHRLPNLTAAPKVRARRRASTRQAPADTHRVPASNGTVRA